MSPYWFLALAGLAFGRALLKTMQAVAWYVFNAFMAVKFGPEVLDKTRRLRADSTSEAIPQQKRDKAEKLPSARGDVRALAPDGDDQPRLPQQRERVPDGVPGDPMLLLERSLRGHGPIRREGA